MFDRDAWIENALRRISYKYPPRSTAKTLSRIARGKYKCAKCEKIHRDKEGHMDHIEPYAPVDGEPIDWNVKIYRMFPYLEGWQRLCIECHVAKSTEENATRRKNKSVKSE
jgi:5-methylcytosine-specific restriction endonuclease McrA